MKLALLLTLLASHCFAQFVAFQWDANPVSEGVTNYVLHWGPSSLGYLRATNCGPSTNFTIPRTSLFSGSNFIALTAQNGSAIDSDFSAETMFLMPPSNPKNFKVKLSMDSSPSPTGPWTETLSLTNSVAVTDAAYFRGRLDIKPSDGLP